MKPNLRTLFLTVSKEPFDVMKTGQKRHEFRKPSRWIKSRLYYPDGSLKDYDFVKIQHGYKRNAPFFIAVYNGFEIAEELREMIYCSACSPEILTVMIEPGDIVINLGDILEKVNI